MISSISYTKQYNFTAMSDRDIPSTYRTKCMLFPFSRSFGDEVKYWPFLSSIFHNLLSKITKEEETECGRCSLATSQLHYTAAAANLHIAVCMHLHKHALYSVWPPQSSECAFFVCACTCERTWKNGILTLAYVHTDSTNFRQYELRRSMHI